MNGKQAKKLKKLAKLLTGGLPQEQTDKRYKQLKVVHKSLKG